LFELGLVAGETVDEAQRLCLTVRMPREDWARWLQQPGVDGELLHEAVAV
jgi:hypothetical protein